MNFEFRILTDDDGAGADEQAMQGLAAMEAAIYINMMYFRRHPETVCALACGAIKYDTANKNVLSMVGEIKTAPVLISTGIGLCIDIVSFDVAIRRLNGIEARPYMISRGGGIFHVVTETVGPGGQLIYYDPSEEVEQLGYAATNRLSQCESCPA